LFWRSIGEKAMELSARTAILSALVLVIAIAVIKLWAVG
jgi:hypothetical protein